MMGWAPCLWRSGTVAVLLLATFRHVEADWETDVQARNKKLTDHLTKQKALSYKKGYVGSMFPWESGATGSEVCPSWASTGQLEQRTHLLAPFDPSTAFS